VLIEGEDVEVELPGGWDGRMRRRGGGAEGASRPEGSRRGLVTVHAGNFPLPAHDGDYGTSATSAMPRRGIFVTLVEFAPGGGLKPGRGLYAHDGLPVELSPSDFSPETMLRAASGQAGVQRFFTAAERPFCLYVVIGSHREAGRLAPAVNGVLRAVRIA
jgi:hypothetical protein